MASLSREQFLLRARTPPRSHDTRSLRRSMAGLASLKTRHSSLCHGVRASSNDLPNYPWEQGGEEWTWHDQTISFVTSDGVYRICEHTWRRGTSPLSGDISSSSASPSPGAAPPGLQLGVGADALFLEHLLSLPSPVAGEWPAAEAAARGPLGAAAEGDQGALAAKGAMAAAPSSPGRCQWPQPPREADYMDPRQALCLAALFSIRAYNGVDDGRLFCVSGFCRSASMLRDALLDTVTYAGGEVLDAQLGPAPSGGLHERLQLTLALPLLWGVPPARDTLTHAIRLGGGIVEKSCLQWVLQR